MCAADVEEWWCVVVVSDNEIMSFARRTRLAPSHTQSSRTDVRGWDNGYSRGCDTRRHLVLT